ncbi:ArnT family glycosyltransferase [Maritalea porphyrae]|uniref:ArnT family glycosyltransferase n=1 Tax=Maritalea porphyrae TaxID=880732 RepID=UPI0022AE729A|nr:glycosyltransferase family 39 protein [Maritalea porphyrae]MCZ4270787.1 glycosyltransferase family 39 protein [Maritalea porphyrae]
MERLVQTIVQKRLLPLVLVALVFIAAKIIFALITIVAADEAYYWVWGENLALSYFDHPPLNAWLIGLTSIFFDNNVFAMRLPTFLTFAGTLYVYWLFACRLFPKAPERAFLLTTIGFLASPTLFAWTSIVYNDHLLIFLSLAATYAFADYFSAYSTDERTSTKPLYAGALLLGLAALSKYNAAFLGVSIAALVIAHPRLRTLLLRPHIFVAGLLCVLMLTPVLLWNIQHDFASFELHLVDRYDRPLFTSFKADTFIRYLASTFIYFGPVLMIPLVAIFFRQRDLDQFGNMTIWIARLMIAFTFVTFTALSTRGAVHWYWGAIAYALMLPFLPILLKNMWLYGVHIVLGLTFVVYATVNYSYAPVELLLGGQSSEVARVYGWPEAGELAVQLERKHGPIYLATTGYPTAAQLAHTLDRTDIYDLDPRPSHFSFVERKAIAPGADAVILHDQFGNLEGTAARFERFSKIETFVYTAHGVDINKFEFYLGEGFISDGDQ